MISTLIIGIILLGLDKDGFYKMLAENGLEAHGSRNGELIEERKEEEEKTVGEVCTPLN